MADPNNLNEFVDAANVKIKRPKRVLHFSDGILEEFSDDDVDNNNVLQMMSEKKQFTDEVSLKLCLVILKLIRTELIFLNKKGIEKLDPLDDT